jgi:hypothetical protein
VFVWFDGAPTQFMSHGAETRKMILANLERYKVYATAGVKTTSPTGAKTNALILVIQTH